MGLCLIAVPILLSVGVSSVESETAEPSYADGVERLERRRQILAWHHRQENAAHVLEHAGQLVSKTLSEQILPSWYGTLWAFSGLAARPHAGPIACGTFVATVLRDAGFRLDRVAMGRLASEHIALSLTRERNLRRYRNEPVERVEADLIAWGPGVYAIGLDTHAGLIIIDPGGEPRFVHSSYYSPGVVLSEPLVGDNPFNDSRYRVAAKLFDKRMMRAWLAGARFEATAG